MGACSQNRYGPPGLRAPEQRQFRNDFSVTAMLSASRFFSAQIEGVLHG